MKTSGMNSAPRRSGGMAADQGFAVTSNPHAPASREYYSWHAEWHRAMGNKAADAREHRLAEQYFELATLYGRMADDAGVL